MDMENKKMINFNYAELFDKYKRDANSEKIEITTRLGNMDNFERGIEDLMKEYTMGDWKEDKGVFQYDPKYYDEEIDKLYYYRLVATKIQRARKYANLHPWDLINAYYTGESKYNLDTEQAKQIINSICKVNLIKLGKEETFYSKQFEDLDIMLHLQMV